MEEPGSMRWVPRLALGVGAWHSHGWTHHAHSSGLGLPPEEEPWQVRACTRWLLRDTTLRGFLPAGGTYFCSPRCLFWLLSPNLWVSVVASRASVHGDEPCAGSVGTLGT